MLVAATSLVALILGLLIALLMFLLGKLNTLAFTSCRQDLTATAKQLAWPLALHFGG